MPLFVASLNSGSNGNCYYIGNGSEAVLIDAGLSCRETERRMKRLDLKMEQVKAVFISHEHGDHIKGVEGIAAKHKLPIYITAATLQHGRLRIPPEQIMSFKAHEPVGIGSLSVLAFPKWHDAIDPHSFVVSGEGVNIGVFTDIGEPCQHVADNFKKCHAAFLEANYDVEMLENGRYPIHLKRRITGQYGHLSNHQALELFLANKPAHMTHLYLSHLSRDNNSAEIALRMFAEKAGSTKVSVASRDEPTGVYLVGPKQAARQVVKPRASPAVQISLFG